MKINNTPDTRLLEQRSRLEFHYPKKGLIIFVPFYQNPSITESKTANLVEYNPLGRSSSLFAYTGAKARRIKVSVPYTLPHLMNFNMGVEKFRRLVSGDSHESARKLFTQFSEYKPEPLGTSLSMDAEKRYWTARKDQEGFEKVLGETAEDIPQSTFAALFANVGFDTDNFLIGLTPTERHKAMDTLLFFMNIFRTSVDNDAKNPLFGPPLVRLTHGTMYQSIPCVCKNYSIEYVEEAGYDLETLTPRQIKISLDLSEVRVGDFGEFNPAQITTRDNLAGWEAVTNDPLTTDPGQLV